MKDLILVASVLTLAACGGGSVTPPVEGPLNLDIVAGQDQIARAGTPQLSDPVVGQLVRVRTADGRWHFKFELVKTAHAQVTVNGSPVAGAVVCSETVAGNFKPFSVCTNTDSNGKATFFYETGTKAGPQRAEIRGLNAQGQPAVFDTVRAVVEPGPADTLRVTQDRRIATSARVALRSFVIRAADRYGNVIATPSPTAVAPQGWTVFGDTLSTDGSERTGTLSLALGNRTEAVVAHALRDLTKSRWRAQGACGPLLGVSDDRGVAIDSVTFSFTSDSVKYLGPLATDEVQFFWAGPYTRYTRDGQVSSIEARGRVDTRLARQSADSLHRYKGSNIGPIAFVRSADTPDVYRGEGRIHCIFSFMAPGRATLTAF